MKNNLIFCLILFLISTFTVTQAQRNQVNTANIDFQYTNGKVTITYDIVNPASNEQYNINVSIFRENGAKLNVLSLSGDLFEIKGGNGKTIIWEQKKDGYVLDEKIYISLAIATKVSIPITTHLVKSAIYPGWGDYRIRNGKYHFLYGMAGFSAIGTAIYLNNQANKNYNEYKNSFDFSKSNSLFNKSKQQQNFSYVFAASACLVWTIDLASLNQKAKRVRKEITEENSRYYYKKSQQTNLYSSNTGYINTKTPYDQAIERGDKLIASEKYIEAKIAYEEANKFEVTETSINKLITVAKIIEEEKRKTISYNTAISRGQELLNQKKYKEAKSEFESARSIKPKEVYPQSQIDEINTTLHQIELQRQYEEKMEQGIALLKNKNHELAKENFQSALTYKPNDVAALNRIQECDEGIAMVAKRKLDDEYKLKMNQANALYETKRYEDAKDAYNQALSLKPDAIEPKNKIDECEIAIAKLIEAKKEAEYNDLISKARVAKSGNRLTEARAYYVKAQEIFPQELEPGVQIKIIDDLINDKSANNNQVNLASLYVKCKSSVFFVFTSDDERISQGSGFFISESGYAISNFHVFKGSYVGSARIVTDDGKIYQLEVIEKNPDKDYIIFKVLGSPNQVFPAVKIAGTAPKIGENVFAIGNPEGFSQTLSNGIISGYRGDKNNYIQTTTPITHGSSGGPLFNSKGEVIGITTLGQQEGSLFFAINIQKVPYSLYVR